MSIVVGEVTDGGDASVKSDTVSQRRKPLVKIQSSRVGRLPRISKLSEQKKKLVTGCAETLSTGKAKENISRRVVEKHRPSHEFSSVCASQPSIGTVELKSCRLRLRRLKPEDVISEASVMNPGNSQNDVHENLEPDIVDEPDANASREQKNTERFARMNI